MANHSSRRTQRQQRRSGNPARRDDARRRMPAGSRPKPSAVRPRYSDDREPERRAVLEQIREICREMDEALAATEPAEFLMRATVQYATDAGSSGSTPSVLTTMLEMYAHDINRSTMATAYVLSRMIGAEDDRAMVDDLLGPAIEVFPKWIQQVDRIRPTTMWRGVDEAHAQATYAIGLRLATGEQMVAACVVDLGRGGELTGVQMSMMSPEESEVNWRRHVDGGDLGPISAADARAQLRAAMHRGTVSEPKGPVIWTAHWVMAIWVLAMLPTDGSPSPSFGSGARS